MTPTSGATEAIFLLGSVISLVPSRELAWKGETMWPATQPGGERERNECSAQMRADHTACAQTTTQRRSEYCRRFVPVTAYTTESQLEQGKSSV